MSLQQSLLRLDPPVFATVEAAGEGNQVMNSGRRPPEPPTKSLNSESEDMKENHISQNEEKKIDDVGDDPKKVTQEMNKVYKSSTGEKELDELIDIILPPKVVRESQDDDEEDLYVSDLDDDEDSVVDDEAVADLDKKIVEEPLDFNAALKAFKDQNITDNEEEKNNVKPSILYTQTVSKVQATREDLVRLRNYVKQLLKLREARPEGLCEVRADVMSQLFDELLRQVLINQPERGVLLNAIRNEAKMKIDGYSMLANSAVTFGVNKLVAAEANLGDVEAEISKLQDENSVLENKIKAINFDKQQLKVRDKEITGIEVKRREKEITFLKYTQENYNKFIESISSDE